MPCPVPPTVESGFPGDRGPPTPRLHPQKGPAQLPPTLGSKFRPPGEALARGPATVLPATRTCSPAGSLWWPRVAGRSPCWSSGQSLRVQVAIVTGSFVGEIKEQTRGLLPPSPDVCLCHQDPESALIPKNPQLHSQPPHPASRPSPKSTEET